MESHLENLKDGPKMLKMKVAAFIDRKLSISASILLIKPCLGSKLGDLRSRNPFMYVSN